MTSEGFQQFACLHVPHTNRSVPTPARKRLSIRRISHRTNVIRMSTEGFQKFTGLCISQWDRIVLRFTTGKYLAIG